MSYFDFTENRQSRKYPLGMPFDEEFETVGDTQDMEYYNMNNPWNYLGAVSLTPGSSEPAIKDEFATEVKDQNSISPPQTGFSKESLSIQDDGIVLPGTEYEDDMIRHEGDGIIDATNTTPESFLDPTEQEDSLIGEAKNAAMEGRFTGKFLLLLAGVSGIFLYSLLKK